MDSKGESGAGGGGEKGAESVVGMARQRLGGYRLASQDGEARVRQRGEGYRTKDARRTSY